MSGRAPCQMPSVYSVNTCRVSRSVPPSESPGTPSASLLSLKRQTSTFVASGANTAKFVDSSVHVAPRGWCCPGHTSARSRSSVHSPGFTATLLPMRSAHTNLHPLRSASFGGEIRLVRPEHVSSRLGIDLTDGNRGVCLLYTSPSPRDGLLSRMPSSA